VELNVENEENYLKLNCKKINYSLLITSSEEYPQLAFENNANEFKLRTSEVSSIISKTSHAISTDETRIYLNGLYLQLIDEKLRTVAIDGHRLALVDTTEFLGNCDALKDGIIIPRKGVNELKKISENFPEDELTLSVDDSFLYINANNEYYLSVRLIAREYPKYQSVIPNKTSYTMVVDKESLHNAVKRIKILSNEKTNGIKVSINEGQIELSSNHPSLGQAKENMTVSYSDEPIDIGFNAKYLLDTLSVFNDGDIKFEFNNELSPVVVKSDSLPEFLGIIMPLKL
jgi:DNA polymerase-3 subunit beta